MKYLQKSGAAIIGIMIAILVFGIIFGAYLSGIIVENRLTHRSFQMLQALNLAEAGIERGYWSIKNNDWTGWVNDTFAITSFQGVGDIDIALLNKNGSNPALSSTGYVPSKTVGVSRTIEVKLGFDYVVFTEEGLEMKSNAQIDGGIATNSTSNNAIYLKSNAVINGDVLVGVGGDPAAVIKKDGNSVISGKEDSLPSPKNIPTKSEPWTPTGGADQVVSGEDNYVISADVEFNSLSVNNNSSITVTSDAIVYVTGNFDMNSNTTIVVNSGAKLELYVGGTFVLNSNAVINTSEDGSRLAVVVLGTEDINMNSMTKIYGSLYAKHCELVMDSNSVITGVVIAKKVEMKSWSRIYFDAAAVPNLGLPFTELDIGAWQEKY